MFSKTVSLLCLLFCSAFLSGQSLYYVSPDTIGSYTFYFGLFNLETCQDSTIFQIDNSGTLYKINDIAVCPDGNFYVTGPSFSGGSHFAQLNMSDSSLTLLSPIPTTSNSLTCDANGILYGGSGFGIFTYDTNTGDSQSLGFLGWPLAGDMTFLNGELYGTTIDNDLIHISLDDLPASELVFNYPIDPLLTSYGVVSNVVSCDSTDMYITVTSTFFSGTPDTINQIYRIDPVAQTADLVCETPFVIYGATTPNEFLASDCSVSLDLDSDDSSGAPGSDFNADGLFCFGGDSVALADLDVSFYSGYYTDSITIRLLPAVPDGPLEYLQVAGNSPLVLSGQGSQQLTLYPNNPFQITTTNAAIQAALQTTFWHNDAPNPSPGMRTIELIAHASGARTDTAYAYLNVPVFAHAGMDTTVQFCMDASATDLNLLLSSDADTGGNWWPVTAGGAGVFDPTTDPSGAYFYTLDNGQCPEDTAVVTIDLLPLPAFTLGADTHLCAGNVLTLSPSVSGFTYVWQDGSQQGSLDATQPGLYWAEATDGNACQWRDSMWVLPADTFFITEQASPCAFTTYEWEGQFFTADTAVCLNFNSVLGCDSVRCLDLSFQALDSLLLDAIICEGDAYQLGGSSFSQSGTYTVSLSGTNGNCDTLAILDLEVIPSPPPGSLSVQVCPGTVYDFNGMLLDTPGVYFDTLTTATGCDSVLILSLSNWPQPAPPAIMGNSYLCPGVATTLTSSGYTGYSWSTGAATEQIEVLSAGVYGLTVTDANGCESNNTVEVTMVPEPQFEWETQAPPCPGINDGTIVLTGLDSGLAPFLYQLNGGGFSDQMVFDSLPPGSYSVLVRDSVECEYAFSFDLPNPPAWDVAIDPAEVYLLEGQSMQLLASSSGIGVNYQWFPAEGLSCTNCPDPIVYAIQDSMVYEILAMDNQGCFAETQVLVIREKELSGYYIPNVFSPNDDGWNDEFAVFLNPDFYQEIELFQVFDRWGDLLFESKPGFSNRVVWDGYSRGIPASPGVYVYKVVLIGIDGNKKWISGSFTLVR
ncbi:MAG: gliding motility-associated C-terminal domain-containing protein [Saprospiraceae bacterium]